MKSLMLTLCAAGLIIGAGCSKESEKGGPGATAGSGTTAGSKTFQIQVPATPTTVPQGGQDTVAVDVDRGSEFKEKVTLTFKPTEGSMLTVEPPTADLTGDQEKVEITVRAAADAPEGDTNIDVSGTPATGKAVSVKFPVKVTKP